MPQTRTQTLVPQTRTQALGTLVPVAEESGGESLERGVRGVASDSDGIRLGALKIDVQSADVQRHSSHSRIFSSLQKVPPSTGRILRGTTQTHQNEMIDYDLYLLFPLFSLILILSITIN